MKRKIPPKTSIFKYERCECPICMETTSIESRSVTVPCMHEFCLECIGKWLTESSSSLCPLCKQSVKSIIYNILNISTYSKISFPKGFNNAWLLRNKTKNILDNFETIITKIYNTIRTFLLGEKNKFDNKILNYLIYFGNLHFRPKSSVSNINFTNIEFSENEEIWYTVKNLVENRLSFLFTVAHSLKIIKEITTKSAYSFSQLLAILNKYLDPVRFQYLKLEIVTCIQISQDPCAYLEYYIPGDHEHIVYTKDLLLDDSIVSAMITKIFSSIDFASCQMQTACHQINNIDEIFSLLEHTCSFDRLFYHLSFCAYHCLVGTNFYFPSMLRKPLSTRCEVTNKSCDLLKHCFQKEDLSHIEQILEKFEERLIHYEPLFLDDSSYSDEEPIDSGNVVLNSEIRIELSDSEDDAIEIISVNPPIFDLTDSMSSTSDSESDDTDCIITLEPNDQDPVPLKLVKIDLLESQVVDRDELFGVVDFIETPNIFPVSSIAADLEVTESQINIDALDTGSNGETGTCIQAPDCSLTNSPVPEYIYQPRSATDFYEYLLSKNELTPSP